MRDLAPDVTMSYTDASLVSRLVHGQAHSDRQKRREQPFGSPDGSNANLQQLVDDFVDIAEGESRRALSTPAEDHSARLIIGKMGVGKTVYLRRFRAAAVEDDSLYVDHVRTDIPSTSDVVEATQNLLTHETDELWSLIWRRAITRAAISHISCGRVSADGVDPDILAALREYPRLVPSYARERSIYNQVQSIVSDHALRKQLRDYVLADDWADVESVVADALRNIKPVCFYLDCVDDQFSQAPMYWLKCQRGLFSQVMALLQENPLRRIHVIASLRDVVLSDVLRGTHAGRYRQEPHIRVLDWDHEAIKTFLRVKVARLEDEYLMRPGAPDEMTAWLGVSRVRNAARGVSEPVEDYILRHTRMIPRDIVAVGNSICDAVCRARERGRARLSDEEIRELVSSAAHAFADQQLTVCADQIAADMIPEHGAKHGYAGFYTGREEYSKGAGSYGDYIVNRLESLIGSVRADRMGFDDLVGVERAFSETFEGYDHVLDVLWQNGLLGYQTDSRGRVAHFYRVGGADDFKLPRECAGYVFHPCVAHKVRLDPVGPPVRGFGV